MCCSCAMNCFSSVCSEATGVASMRTSFWPSTPTFCSNPASQRGTTDDCSPLSQPPISGSAVRSRGSPAQEPPACAPCAGPPHQPSAAAVHARRAHQHPMHEGDSMLQPFIMRVISAPSMSMWQACMLPWQLKGPSSAAPAIQMDTITPQRIPRGRGGTG